MLLAPGVQLLGVGLKVNEHLLLGGDVVAEGLLAPDRLTHALGLHRAVVDAARELQVKIGALVKTRAQDLKVVLQQIASGANAELVHFALGNFADAPEFADGEFGGELGSAFGGDDGYAIGLLAIGGDFGEEFIVGDAGGGGELEFAADARAYFFCHKSGRAAAERAGTDVEVGFVERHGFDDAGVVGKDGADAPRDFSIGFHTRPHYQGLRAQAQGGARGHRRAHAVRSSFVAGGGDDAALVGSTADDDRLTAQAGVVALLDRGEEGVHVDVDDFAHGFRC